MHSSSLHFKFHLPQPVHSGIYSGLLFMWYLKFVAEGICHLAYKHE